MLDDNSNPSNFSQHDRSGPALERPRWQTWSHSRFGYLLALCLLLTIAGGELFAQNRVGPPGFVPTPDLDSPSNPTSSPSPAPRTYSGSSEFPGAPVNTYGDQYPNAISNATPYPDPSQGRIRRRTFRQPATPAVILIEDEPPMPRIWFRGEALYWWSKSSPMPVPAITTGLGADSPPGAIGQPNTVVLLGNQNINIPGRSGGRYTLGFSFDPAQTWGFEASYFNLSTSTITQSVSEDGSAGSPLLAFPFFNVQTGKEDATYIAQPGVFPGSAVLVLQTVLQGTDLNFIHNVSNSSGLRFDLLGGLRYINFQENLYFNTSSPSVGPIFFGYYNTFDQFLTYNNFYGGQIGLKTSYDINRWYFNATTKLALGATWENVSANGATFTNIGGFASAPGGLFSAPSNIGSQTREQFAVVPELNLNAGYRIRPWASVFVGYSFLYISAVARPGQQLSHSINPSQSSGITGQFPATLTGPAVPTLSVHTTSFWAQGLNFSLEFRF